jgi:hypothetical protein
MTTHRAGPRAARRVGGHRAGAARGARRTGWCWLLAAAAAVAAALPLAAAGPHTAGPHTAGSDTAGSPAGIHLAAGTTGSALFGVDGLVPGHPVVNCLVVHFPAAPSGTPVRLYAVVRSGELAPYLAVTVRTGRGCSGFVPTGTPFRGRLAGLAAAHDRSPAGVLVPWPDGGGVAFEVRVAVADTNAAQGRAVRFDLVWSAPELAPGTDGRSSSARADGPARAGSLLGGLVRGVARLVKAVGLPLLKAGSIGILTAVLVLLFLLVQGAIDRRDPKLALAPVRPPARLRFTDRDEVP